MKIHFRSNLIEEMGELKGFTARLGKPVISSREMRTDLVAPLGGWIVVGGNAVKKVGDDKEDQRRLTAFNAAAAESRSLIEKNDSTRTIQLGRNRWDFPVPIVKKGDGWVYDLEAGRTELLDRTIGFNELSAIEACRAYVAAQREYFRDDQNEDSVQEYAQRILSTPGRRDGLYWPPEKPPTVVERIE